MKYITLCIALTMLLLSSCNRKSDPETDVHDHEEMSLSFTMFASDFEMFTEISPLKKGQKSDVIAHFTKLIDYKPILTGSLYVNFSVGNSHNKIKLKEPARAGIFTFNITPKESGHGHLELIVNSGKLSDTFLVHMEVPEHHNETYDHDHMTEVGDGHHQSEKEDEITFLLEQAWKTDFGIYQSSLKAFSEIIPATGSIQATSKNDYQIVAKHSGIIIFEMENLLPGMELNPADDILIIGSEDIVHDNFETKYAKVKLDFEKAEKDYNRAVDLYAEKIIAQKEYLEIENEYYQVKQDMDLFKAHYKPGGHHIHLKEKGYLKELLVEEGQYVEIGQAVLEITNSKKLLLKAEVQQKYLASLNYNLTANFKVDYDKKTFDLNDYNGKILSIGKSIATGKTLIPVFFEFSNPGNLLPGSYARIYLKNPAETKKLIIPVESLIETQGDYHIIVQTSGESYSKRDVKIGATDGQMIEILEGLVPGEVVVTKGAYRVYLASMSSDLPAHAHVH